MKSVWKLIVKCVCVMMPFVVLGCGMEQNMMAFVDGEAPYYIWNREKTNTTQDKKYRVVVLGDSTSNAAYAPEALSQDTINLSLGGTTSMANYYILQDWLAHNPAPDVCYLSFMDFHLQKEDCFWTRTMYSHRLSLRQNLEMMRSAIAYQEPSILTERYWMDYISYQMFLPNKYITSFMNASFNQRYEANSNAVKANDLHGGRYIARGTNEYNVDDPIIYDEFQVSPLFDEYYRKIIELCVDNGITPRIVKLPLPDNCQFTDNYMKMFHDYYDSLQREYPSLTVDWPQKTYPKNYFADADHMNSHGALQFGNDLKKLYPEDFSTTEMDENQIAAIDDSIRGENKIEWILRWIDGKDYTVLFYDKRGEFGKMYEGGLKEEWGTGGLHRMDVLEEGANVGTEGADARAEGAATADGGEENDAKGKTSLPMETPEVWAVSGTGEGASLASASLSVSLAEDGLALRMEGQEPQAWATASDDVLGVAVVNHYTRSVVCMKSFRYVDEAFSLVQ